MLFNTVRYAAFFAVAFVGAWLLASKERGRLRIVFLLLMSYGFYANWDVRYLPLIFGSSTVDFFLAKVIARAKDPVARRRMLAITVVLNLGFLSVFKYTNFIVESFLAMKWAAGQDLGLVAFLKLAFAGQLPDAPKLIGLPPVGISFFTFESMSYVIDVYRGDLEPHDSYLEYLLFVAFFPHLVAGPIVRPRDLLPQLAAPPKLSVVEGGQALFLGAIGLLKKVAIADPLALNLVDRVFDRPDLYSGLETLAGVYGYAVQIYFDFSGYSDIAIASALLLGVRFPKNFDAPYKAASLTIFWRKWHISLSTWLRDYLYVPLGGNRQSTFKTYRNLMLTMVLGGLWHGAAWTFVFWGFLHGLGLAVNRAWDRMKQRRGLVAKGALAVVLTGLGVLLTFHWVCLAWVFFRAPSFAKALAVLRKIATMGEAGGLAHGNLGWYVLTLLGLGLVGSLAPSRLYEAARAGFVWLHPVAKAVVLFLVLVLLHEVAAADAVPFVYFQF